MKLLGYLAIAAAMAAAAMSPAAAATTIVGLYGTGVDDTGVVTTGNGADLHWTIAGAGAFTGAANGIFPIGPWLADDEASRWVTPTGNAGDSLAATSYTYSTSFSLAGFDATTASFSGRFAADDQVTAIILNGTTISTGGGGFSFYTGFNSTGGTFLAGANTLSFVAHNSGGGPTGFRAEIAGTADVAGAVPEPATWMLMTTGFGFVGVARRRRAAMATA